MERTILRTVGVTLALVAVVLLLWSDLGLFQVLPLFLLGVWFVLITLDRLENGGTYGDLIEHG
jgi:hypothetical protein